MWQVNTKGLKCITWIMTLLHTKKSHCSRTAIESTPLPCYYSPPSKIWLSKIQNFRNPDKICVVCENNFKVFGWASHCFHIMPVMFWWNCGQKSCWNTLSNRQGTYVHVFALITLICFCVAPSEENNCC